MQKIKRMISRRWDGTSKENGSSRSTCSLVRRYLLVWRHLEISSERLLRGLSGEG